MLSTSERPKEHSVATQSTDSAMSRNPRRQPAHLSVSLRHEGPRSTGPHPSSQPSEGGNRSGDTGLNAQTWFDQSNKHPEAASSSFQDNEPPYFLPHNSSNTSEDDSPDRAHDSHFAQRAGMLHTATNGSSADDFRSVIDDLTIENRKLKEKLRRYKKITNTHLDKDKLFEVKIHALPSRKRRELENTLRAFASSLEDSTDENKSKISPSGNAYPAQVPGAVSGSKPSASSSTSNSRPVDSAYASMSNSGNQSNSKLTHVGLGGKESPLTQVGKEQKIQSYLHNIPQGLLPKHSSVLTDRQKKKIVVQRLEQLFVGRQGVQVGENSHPLQQQEVSKSAARADRVLDKTNTVLEGHREAYMLPQTKGDGQPGKLPEEPSVDTETIGENTDSSIETSPDRASPEQRPTRPLDLDPDRAQIPSENVDYIRHLGLSTPHLASDDSTDSAVEAVDADGWIYLNLLVNMAQLHIINVTADFVRSAISELSQKFQLSRDGNKVRWRGGHKGTKFSSSDSGTSSGVKHSSHDLDENGSSWKRRKLHIGKFQSVPVEGKAHTPNSSAPRSRPTAFHYKPLFHHQGSSSEHMSTDDSDFCYSRNDKKSNNAEVPVQSQPLWNPRSLGMLPGKRRSDDGLIVFYSGANFCTDLSGDREGIITPLHVFGIGKDGYSNHTEDALGCQQVAWRPTLPRTESGSLFPFRPFKDYSRGPAFLETRPKTPEPLKSDADEDFFVNELPRKDQYIRPLQTFEASGLGGTQPADHFALKVDTARPMSSQAKTKVSKFSAPTPNSRRIRHRIAKSSLERFHHEQRADENLTARLAALGTFSPPSSPPLQSTSSVVEEMPVKAEIISFKVTKLQPSQLPPPLGYYTTYSISSDSDSEMSDDSSIDLSKLRNDRSYLYPGAQAPSEDEEDEDEDDDESMDGDDDNESSIDMLAQARELDPVGVMRMEMEIDQGVREVGRGIGEGVRSSVATIDEESAVESDEVDGASDVSS